MFLNYSFVACPIRTFCFCTGTVSSHGILPRSLMNTQKDTRLKSRVSVLVPLFSCSSAFWAPLLQSHHYSQNCCWLLSPQPVIPSLWIAEPAVCHTGLVQLVFCHLQKSAWLLVSHCIVIPERNREVIISHKNQGLWFRNFQEPFPFYAFSEILLIWINWMRGVWPQNNLVIAPERAEIQMLNFSDVLWWARQILDGLQGLQGAAVLTSAGLRTRWVRPDLSACMRGQKLQ